MDLAKQTGNTTSKPWGTFASQQTASPSQASAPANSKAP